MILIFSKDGFRSSREYYGDAAIGYVCLKHDNTKCTIGGFWHLLEETAFFSLLILCSNN